MAELGADGHPGTRRVTSKESAQAPVASVERKFTLRDNCRQGMRAVTGQVPAGATVTKLSPPRQKIMVWALFKRGDVACS